MKKLIPIIGALFATMLFAGEPPALCTEKPWLPQCDQGQVGPQGEKGDTGEQGPAGADGKDGKDGRDGKDFNSKGYELTIKEFLKYGKEATEYYEKSAAGAAAIAAIDFGSTCKGVTVGGIGVGTSKSFTGRSNAVGVGIKHGLTDTDAVIVKGWVAGSDAHAIGAGFMHRF